MKLSILNRRLLPLYISSFFGGLVFWYAIEKVFMESIGFSALNVTIQVVVLSVTGLILEVPSGILADRWSRKGVMCLAYFALALASLILGLAQGVVIYTIASILFGTYFALHSGTVDSIIYDTLVEENSSREGFEKYLGHNSMLSVVGLIVGSLLGSIIAGKTSLQAAYFLTVPSALIAMLAAIWLREPTLHKRQAETELLLHTRQTFKQIFQRGYIAWVITAVIATSVLFSFMLEIDQLWPLALNMPLTLYGPLNALLLTGYGLGSYVAYRLSNNKFVLHLSYAVSLILVLSLSLQNMAVIAGVQFLILVLFVSFYTIAIGKMHDVLPSNLRNGASSLVNTLINVAFIPSILAVGLITQKYSIFHAPYIMLPIAVVGVISMIVALRHNGAMKPAKNHFQSHPA